MRTASKEFGDEKESEGVFAIWDCGSPLYDSYELVSLAYTIERHMMVWPYLGGPKPIVSHLSHPWEEVISTTSSNVTSSLMGELLMKGACKRKLAPQGKKKKKHKKIKAGFSGFYGRLVCGGHRVYK